MYFETTEYKFKHEWHLRKASNYEGTIYILWDIFIGYDTSLSFASKTYLQKPRDNRKYIPGPIVSYIDNIIVIGSSHMYNNWGHTMQDFFHPFILLPKEIRESYHILVNFCKAGEEILLLMGYRY